ncbi:MAG: NADPH-dependent FMN reductase [Patescibacteria group bacterium]|jgi:NAD(P)H-dependent FMN reductase
MKQIKLGIVIGSVRKNRATIRPAKALVDLSKNFPIEVKELDLLDFNLPIYDESHPKQEQPWIDAIKTPDALILVFPEYNFRPCPAILNALDYLRKYEIKNKIIGLVSVSNGNIGGIRAQAVMRSSLPTFGVYLLPTSVAVPNVEKTFPINGAYDENIKEKLKQLISELIDLTNKLKK